MPIYSPPMLVTLMVDLLVQDDDKPKGVLKRFLEHVNHKNRATPQFLIHTTHTRCITHTHTSHTPFHTAHTHTHIVSLSSDHQ